MSSGQEFSNLSTNLINNHFLLFGFYLLSSISLQVLSSGKGNVHELVLTLSIITLPWLTLSQMILQKTTIVPTSVLASGFLKAKHYISLITLVPSYEPFLIYRTILLQVTDQLEENLSCGIQQPERCEAAAAPCPHIQPSWRCTPTRHMHTEPTCTTYTFLTSCTDHRHSEHSHEHRQH